MAVVVRSGLGRADGQTDVLRVDRGLVLGVVADFCAERGLQADRHAVLVLTTGGNCGGSANI